MAHEVTGPTKSRFTSLGVPGEQFGTELTQPEDLDSTYITARHHCFSGMENHHA